MPQSLQISKFGGPEVFKLVEQASAPLNDKQVRIKVATAGVNFADIMMRMGLYPEAPPTPFVPGYEVAGTVTEVGKSVTAVKPGDRVLAGSKFGGYTTEIVLEDFFVRKTPERLSDAEAACIPVNFMTAWVALEDMARVRKGDRVLVQSAAGGVGVAAVQIAKRRGAHVVGVCSASKAQVVKDLGAAEVIANEDWENGSDKDLGGFEIILDPTGGKSLKRSFRRLSGTGRIVNFGMASAIGGEKRNIFKLAGAMLGTPFFTPFKLMNENKGIFGLNMLQLFEPPVGGKETVMGRCFDEVIAAFNRGEFRTLVGKTFPLAEGGAAHSFLQSRGAIGKVVLTC